MDHQLEGRVAIVTGASRGIGRAIAEAPAGKGVRSAQVTMVVGGATPGGPDPRQPAQGRA